jgi:hypothetical protein
LSKRRLGYLKDAATIIRVLDAAKDFDQLGELKGIGCRSA